MFAIVGVLLGASILLSGVPTAARADTEDPHGDAEYDPLKPVNRRIFWFNDTLDVYVLTPVATGWDRIAPDPVQRSVSNFFNNLRFPINTLNNLLQGKAAEGASEVGRFGVNTTVGFLGFFDPATEWGLQKHPEDFGQTLGWWGVSPGPYLVLPLLGPSNPRDTGGLLVDYVASVLPFFVNQWILLGAGVTDTVNDRSLILEEVRDAKEAAVDYYALVRNAYVDRRAALVNDSSEVRGEQQDELYELEPDRNP